MNQHRSNQYSSEQLQQFKNANKQFFRNPIIQSFFNHEDHVSMLQETMHDPTNENKERLDQAFKQFYFNIRFTSFISSSLYFDAIHFDQKQRQYSSRYLLLIDQPLQNEEAITLKDTIADPSAQITMDDIIRSEEIDDYIENIRLYNALQKLSLKQKEILYLSYVSRLSDTEIANKLQKSQQAVSKLRKKALQKIYHYMNNRG
ncbi:hypothetical protein NG54_09915 [Heyndrickxia ginsengihumi]|uniref:RNA polymerase sigma-70 region 4 domain-containing protein n=1 Tax=Heyndrickxia ginsengihumi TaxID=363870 RepID=A0A0A6XYZ7_9BACI|nr:sigma-70 family RNA polymerase sigma factor [Heyndrickxia ginsengihumi]KHD85327.1 hypothetical protein NG54_09915 [Heyndrickxia ginsengihumi]